MKRSAHHSSRSHGFTLVEALILMVVLSIVGLGVGVGLQSAVRTPEATDTALAISAEFNSEMDAWRAQAANPANFLAMVPYTKTDTVILQIGGRSLTYARVTTISKWDPNNLATNLTPQADFYQVKITINGQVAIGYITTTI